jgi:pimeloyl-ACP methyl ester carboxylesterase
MSTSPLASQPASPLAQPSRLKPTPQQVQHTVARIEAYLKTIVAHPDRRPGAFPYYLFHPADRAIRGTVMIFHGFSAKPHQMGRLASYLFENGFNVYQPSIAGHALVRPDVNWPQVDLRPEIAKPLKAKIAQDKVLTRYFSNLANNPNFTKPNRLQQIGLIARLLTLEPRLLDMVNAIETPGDPDFDRYYISNHMIYLDHAKARLAELDVMPGPIYAIGLSIGGAIALGLAATYPQRIRRVVAYAPLLQIYTAERRRYVNLAGPLDIKETGWDPTLQFPVGCLTAADRFGSSYVLHPQAIEALKTVQTLMVLTENEDAADIDTNKEFFINIGGKQRRHFLHLYQPEDLVPHPMIDPEEISQNMSNRYWQSLYQETFRFLSTGVIHQSNLFSLEQSTDVPLVER